jgi:ParB-like nuclease domain
MSVEQKEVKTECLLLDPDNPRFFELRELTCRKELSQNDLMEELEKDSDLPSLMRSIRRDGVKDPIWVKPLNGKLLVIEGNRRTCILSKLLEEKVTPPKGVKYDTVLANVLPSETTETELLLQRVRLQTGKKDWGPFNEAVATYDLRHKHLLEEEDIATELQISRRDVRQRINNYRTFLEFVKATGFADPRRFSFFADAPKPVRDWIDRDEGNKKKYFELITPQNGIQRIRSVATKGGLRDFQKIIGYETVLREFLDDKDLTVEEALETIKGRDVTLDAPILGKISGVSSKLSALTDDQIEKLKEEKTLLRSIKQLYRVCKGILEKTGENVQ